MYDLNHYEAHFASTDQEMPEVAAREYADALRAQSMIRQSSAESATWRLFVERLVKTVARMASRPRQRWNTVSQ